MENKNPRFEVIVAGIIFDPEKKKILIGRRKEKDPYVKNLEWCFPGGRLGTGEEIDSALKKKIELKTGYKVKNIGTFFSRTYNENPNMVSILFLTKAYDGKEAPGDDLGELKWIKPKDIDRYFKTSIHNKLREFLHELV